MNAQEYIAAGHAIEADGWTITLSDEHSGGRCPVAVHHDTGVIMELEFDCGGGYWSQDWQMSPLDGWTGCVEHWSDPALLIEDLRGLLADGRLRAEGAVHGIPGASTLGSLLC